MCFISFIVSCSLLGSPVVDISTATNKGKWQFYRSELQREINGTEMQREKTVKNMKTCAYNTGYYEWLCVRVTLRIMQ